MAPSDSSSSPPASDSANKPKKQTIVIGGIHANVYSQRSAPPAGHGAPVVVMFLLHGRGGSAHRMTEPVASIFEELHHLRASGGLAPQGFLIVTIDHRNHGKRVADEKANIGWFDDPDKNNERHAIDMYAIQTGTAQDVSYLIDFLPSYLFPNGERTVSQWLCAGKSLGGHSTWITLKNDPRVKIGIPIIGCPDYFTLITKRAKAHKLPIGPPHLPDSLIALIKRADPAAAPYTASDESNPFYGKKILVLSGQDDKNVPWSAGKTFVENLNVGQHGVKEVIIEPGVGHEFSPAMIKELARFVWKHALTA